MSGAMISVLWAEAPGAAPVLPSQRPDSMRGIAERVAEAYDLTLEDMKGPARKRSVSWPRQEAMWLMYQTKRYSLTQIGETLGDRHHTSVLHGIRAHQARISGEVAA